MVVSLIEETIQREVERGGFAGKIGEQLYLGEVLFRGEAVLGRKKVTQRVSVSMEVPSRPVPPVGSSWKGASSLRLVHSVCGTLCRLGASRC